MTKHKDDGYVDAVQERMDGDLLKAMIELMAERHERTRERGASSLFADAFRQVGA